MQVKVKVLAISDKLLRVVVAELFTGHVSNTVIAVNAAVWDGVIWFQLFG